MLARYDIVLVAFLFTDGPNVKPHDHAGATACAPEDRHAARGSAASLRAHPAGACGCGGTLSGLAFGPRPPDPLRQRRGAPLPAGSRLPDQGAAELEGAACQGRKLESGGVPREVVAQRLGVGLGRWEEIERACSVGVVLLGVAEVG